MYDMYLYEKQETIEEYPCFKKIGYDVFDERLNAQYLYRLLHKKPSVLKAVLLDQNIMAGIGNIYADEICFAMKMHPETKISHLRKKDFEEYMKTQEKMSADYQDRDKWIEKAILNTASAGFFSSDRTIEDLALDTN